MKQVINEHTKKVQQLFAFCMFATFQPQDNNRYTEHVIFQQFNSFKLL